MPGGVFVLRRATTDVAADRALREMNPGVPHLQALLAAIGAWGHVPYLVQVRALSQCVSPLLTRVPFQLRKTTRLILVILQKPEQPLRQRHLDEACDREEGITQRRLGLRKTARNRVSASGGHTSLENEPGALQTKRRSGSVLRRDHPGKTNAFSA
jgi:hypothetical protein